MLATNRMGFLMEVLSTFRGVITLDCYCVQPYYNI